MNHEHNDSNGHIKAVSLELARPSAGLTFPFKTFLSFKPLIDLWRQHAADASPVKSAAAKQMLAELVKAPALTQPVVELEAIEKHKALLDQLFSLIVPHAYWENIYAAASAPFQLLPFHATPGFKLLNLMNDKGGFNDGLNIEPAQAFLGRNLNAYSHILRRYYDVETQFEYPLIFTAPHPRTGLPRHYKINIDLSFVEIKKVGESKPLSPAEIRQLLANPSDLELWYELIPPECFEFHGFAVFNAVDVTDQEVLSSLKNDLLEKDAIISSARFQNLQEKLRALLQRPGLQLGLAGIPGAQNLLREHGREIGKSFILNDACRQQCATFSNSIYDHVMRHDAIVIIENLVTYPTPTQVEQAILRQGIKNIFIAPLHYENKFIGLLELGSANPGDINAINSFKLREVFPLLAIAIKRSLDEFNDRVEAIIKEKCTAIHPAVEWRFRHAALKLLQNRQRGLPGEMEPIIFEDVYPLYGLSDMRGSSTLRNDAIRADLTEQLQLVSAIITAAHELKKLPYLEQLAYRLEQQLQKIEHGLDSGDETGTLEFLRREIEPRFEQLQGFSPDLREQIAAYRAGVDPQLGFVYRRRKDFEASVTQLNETICAYIDAQQQQAQAMFPHYFEKYKSDGVDHGIYIGAALVENGKFDQLYLKNIRLWQLQMMIGVARRVEAEKPKLKMPLDIAHLILVQSTPLAIRFRYDEKKFDVDGAYNVRYEIMKKRIDKAVVKGGNERLTQPGKIAIIYSQPREAAEYREYIDYLQAAGELTSEVEEVELEDLQGMRGLKALRVQVCFETPECETPSAAVASEPEADELIPNTVEISS